MRTLHSIRTATARGMAALLATATIFASARSAAAPADIFSSPAPVMGNDPPKAAELRDGEGSVSTQTGVFTYSYPIAVPAGRGGMAPSLSLNYSSQAPIYGTIADGWSLSIPAILEDTSVGALSFRAPEVEQQQTLAAAIADDRFISTLSGNRPLVRVTEPTSSDVRQTYRAQNDSTYTRYEGIVGKTYYWRALSPTGTVMYFGDTTRMGGCPNVGPRYAPLTGQTDPFGNEIVYRYSWTADTNDCRLSEITWGTNAGAGITQPFARVAFNWTATTMNTVNGTAYAVGSSRSYRSGALRVEGGARLSSIVVTSFPPGGVVEHTRQISLAYSLGQSGTTNTELTSSAMTHAPVRQLHSIQESAWGASSAQPRVDLPEVDFTYADPTVQLNTGESATSTPWGTTTGAIHPNNLGWGFRHTSSSTDDRWPTVEGMMVDLDGDGLLDRLENTSAATTDGSITSCKAQWKRNIGPNISGQLQFETTWRDVSLPRLNWYKGESNAQRLSPNLEACSLSGQVTTYSNSHELANICHDGSLCAHSADPDNATALFCYPGGTACPKDAGGGGIDGQYRTYLAYRWLDADGDGLVDLVAAIHGDADTYDPDVGNGPGTGQGTPLHEAAPFGLGTWPSCPGHVDECKNLGSCLGETQHCTSGLCATNWPAINSCLSSTVATACFGFLSHMGSPSQGGNVQRAPYSRCEGLYPWFIFKNSGNGAIATTPIVKYNPVPLESETGDSQLGGPVIFSENHAVDDFDGDGWLDGIAHAKTATSPAVDADAWWVWLGDGKGGMGPKRYYFPTRPAANGANRISAADGNVAGTQVTGLLDFNADGLPDHWLDTGNNTANIAFNDGTQLQVYNATKLGETTAPFNPSSVSTLNTSPAPHYEFAGGPVQSGQTNMSSRVVDVDSDGRQDLVKFTSVGVGTVYYNVGGQFLPFGAGYPGDATGAWRSILGTVTTIDQYEDRLWELRTDLMDLDGDGIPEVVAARQGQFQRSVPAGPPRLMIGINTNRGAHTTISYASMHSSAVTQSPSSFWFDGRPKSTPAEQWVVSKIQVDDDYSPGASSTSYTYANPRHGKDDYGHFAFRGFETATATGPSGARSVQTYGYDVDWSGRLMKTSTFAAGHATDPVSVDATTYGAFTLFGGALTTYNPVLSEHFTCADGQSEAACSGPSAAPVIYTASDHAYLAKASDTLAGQPLMYVEASARSMHARAKADGDRVITSSFVLAADGGIYRLRPDTVTSQVQTAGSLVTYAKKRITWEASAAPVYARKLTEQVWIDNNDAHRLVTNYTYDSVTGNLSQVATPRGHITSYEYDARQLDVVYEDLPGFTHYRQFAYEYGTGAKTLTIGPNVATCSPSCTLTGTQTGQNQDKLVIDGFGRMLEHWSSVNVTNTSGQVVYDQRKVEMASYFDFGVFTSLPRYIVHSALLDKVGSTETWTTSRTDLDGHGRTIVATQYATTGAGSVPADTISAYVYAPDGTLTSARTPDPSQNDGSQVTYAYTYDSLGRPLTMRRPGGATGADMSYATTAALGVTTSVREVTGDSAARAETRRTLDSDGRLAKVEEKTAEAGGVASAWATTLYAYDAANNVTQITDPESVITTMAHDFAGRRTSITRAGKSWEYAFDADGNVASEVTSCTPQPTCRAAYTTTFAYDSLDRVTTKSLAPRTLVAADQDLFGAKQESFTWDTATNGRGQLARWQALGASANVVEDASFSYDPVGRPTNTSSTFAAAGYNTSRSQSQTYYPGGLPLRTTYGDQAGGGSTSTFSELTYDTRGLPLGVSISTDGSTFGPPVAIKRNVAGVVLERRVEFPSGSPMTLAQSVWAYDSLGRLTSQTVNRAAGTLVQVAKQTMSYFGNDDISTLTTYFGATAKPMSFTYDYRHQLGTATASPSSYFSGTYLYGAAGRLTRAKVSQTITPLPSGTEVRPRDVFYNYAGADPEEVSSLNTGSQTGNPYAAYTYDLAGNQLSRSEPATDDKWTYVYDGKDQLRRAKRQRNKATVGSEEYWYDSSGARTQVVKRDAVGAVTELVWYAGATEAHYSPSATSASRAYTLVSVGTPVARIDRTSNTATTTEYQFHGLASSTLATISSSGVTNTTFNYGPFGEVLESTNAGGTLDGTATHKRRHNDQVVDDLTGLAYYGARYYDRTLLNWTQLDPLYLRVPDLAKQSTPRRSNLGVFSLNNPVRYLDPDGRDVVQRGPTEGEMYDRDRAARVAAAGGGETTATIAEAAWWKSLGDHLFDAGGVGPDWRTTSRNACDGIHGVCDDADDIARLDLPASTKEFLFGVLNPAPPTPEGVIGLAITLSGHPWLGAAVMATGAESPEEVVTIVATTFIGEALGAGGRAAAARFARSTFAEAGEWREFLGAAQRARAASQAKWAIHPDMLAMAGRFTADEQALVALAKRAHRTGVSATNANILLDWASELGMYFRNDIGETHWVGGGGADHIHIGPVDHIRVK